MSSFRRFPGGPGSYNEQCPRGRKRKLCDECRRGDAVGPPEQREGPSRAERMALTSNAGSELSVTTTVRDWLALARLPFHSVGVLPFVLGTVLAVRSGVPLSVDLLAAGLAVVVCVMLATYLLGEFYDFETDRLSAQMERNRFSGGSQVLQSGRVDRRYPRYVAAAATVIAGLAGIYVIAATREYVLIPLGLFGAVSGAFYSAPPFRWAHRGVGEALIGICYGWLPVAVGFLMQAGELPWSVSLISVPVGLTIFNVILINEFPDEPADRLVGKKTLVVRLGRRGASFLYAAVAALTAGSLAGLVCAFSSQSAVALAAGGALCALPLGLSGAMLGGLWRNRDALEKMCGLSIVLNLSVNVALMLICRV